MARADGLTREQTEQVVWEEAVGVGEGAGAGEGRRVVGFET